MLACYMRFILILIIINGINVGQVHVHYIMLFVLQRSLVAKVQRHQLPELGMLFLNLTVRRSHMVSDSLNEVLHYSIVNDVQ